MSDQVTNKNAVPEESQVRVLEMALPSSASSSDMLLRRIGTYWWRGDAPWLRSSRSVATLSLVKTSARGFLVFIRWNSAQSKTYGCNHCVKLAAVRSSPQVQIL